MKYSKVYLDSLAYELGPNVVTTEELEERLASLYDRLRVRRGQLEALTGIRERRWWNPEHLNADAAGRALERALAGSRVRREDLGVLMYAGVCRDHLEPATACDVAARIGAPGDCEVFDVSNACLGVLNGIVTIANRIELGQIRAGAVVSCESAREITETMIEHMLNHPDMETFRLSLATLTGGSGAVAVVLSDGSYGEDRPRLAGGSAKAAPEHNGLCQWQVGPRVPFDYPQFFHTDGAAVLKHGVPLGVRTWQSLLGELGWQHAQVDRVVCHQVGRQHRDAILSAIDIEPEKDFSSFEFLGNMGTVSLPVTAALAAERGAIDAAQKVAFLGIGSGLNCLMLGWEW